MTPLRFFFHCHAWVCTHVCKRVRVQGIVGGIKGYGGRLGGVVGLGCGTPPCDPTQVLFPVLLLSLHARVQTCKGTRECGGGDEGIWGRVGGCCGAGLWDLLPPQSLSHHYLRAIASIFAHARANVQGVMGTGGRRKGDTGVRVGVKRVGVGLKDPPR